MENIGRTDLIFNISNTLLNSYETEALQFGLELAGGWHKTTNYPIL